MMTLSDDTQADIIEALNSTSRYLHDLLNINNPYFEGMVTQIYPTELQLNSTDNEAAGLDLPLLIFNGFVSSKIYDKRNNCGYDIVNFPFLDGDVLRAISYMFIFLSLFGLHVCLVICLTSMLVTKR